MKTLKIKFTQVILVVCLSFLLAGFLQAQTDSLESVCEERGHILEGLVSVTLMYCPPQIVDLPDRTIKIVWNRNYRHGFCERCGKEIYEPVQEKPDTVITWKRE